MADISEDSDDSDGEGGMGNVNRLIMRPMGHSGKAKRGHLCFDASFETGNLGRVDLVSEYEYDLYIRPDTCCPRLRFWFNFTVDNVRLQQRVVFNIVNMSKTRNLFNAQGRMVPVVRSTSRPKWQHLGKHLVFYQRSPLHRNHCVLSFAFVFDKEDEIYHFALTYPYGYNRAQAFLAQVESRCAEFGENFHRECIAQTQTSCGCAFHRCAFPMHNCETPYCCDDRPKPWRPSTDEFRLPSTHSIATRLREHILFVIVPMLNPDGVYVGNYRSTIVGADLNRMWHRASPFAHPALTAVISYLTTYERDKAYQLDFVIDIHAHSSLLGSFIYGNCYGDVYRNERHQLFPKLLANVADDFDIKACMYNSCPSKAGTARRYFCNAFNEKLNAYSFEVSMFGYKLKGSDVIVPYTEESYKRCGRNLLRAILEFYSAMEVLPMAVVASVKERRRMRKERRIRPCKISSSRCQTQRIAAPLHYKDINIYYESEKAPAALQGRLQRASRMASPVLMVMPPAREPCLSIIDFNIITEKELRA